MKVKYALTILILAVLMGSCKKKKVDSLKSEFKITYANIVFATYEDAYNAAVALEVAINAFVDAPTAAGLTAAQNAWYVARESYGQSETFRFSNGPIDDEDGPEGSLNAWPLDEAYIDYVVGAPTSGIINDPTITIDKATLLAMNEEGGEKNISLGYHAIEFLLWGQDDANTTLKTPGNRPYTDYVTDGTGTSDYQARRGAYLKVCAAILVENLTEMIETWKVNGAYRSLFISQDDNLSIASILTGMGVLSKSELAGERVFTALDNQDQEDEHSCFSDNTHRDIITNFQGIYNIYRGRYSRTDGSVVSGTGLEDIIEKADKKLNLALSEHFEAANLAVIAIPVPFDYALTLETPGSNGPINTTVSALRALGDKIAEAGAALDLSINTALPE